MITQNELLKNVRYCPESGKFYKRIGQGGVASGSETGTFNGRYMTISVNGSRMLAHRAAFLYMTGEVPAIVDHIDGNKTNNAWGNLREASRSQNCQNAKQFRTNSSGEKGVYWSKRDNKWKVTLDCCGKRFWFGQYKNKDEAIKVARKERARLHGQFASTGLKRPQPPKEVKGDD